MGKNKHQYEQSDDTSFQDILGMSHAGKSNRQKTRDKALTKPKRFKDEDQTRRKK